MARGNRQPTGSKDPCNGWSANYWRHSNFFKVIYTGTRRLQERRFTRHGMQNRTRRISLSLALILLCASHLYAQVGHHYPLPIKANVKIGESGSNPSNSEEPLCHGFTLSQHQVRNRFRTYHHLADTEEHDYYEWFPCWVRGTVHLTGRDFFFRANYGNTMETNFPDGKFKVLGGLYDDDPSGEIPKHDPRYQHE